MNIEQKFFAPAVERKQGVAGTTNNSFGDDSGAEEKAGAAESAAEQLERLKQELSEMKRKAQGLIDRNRFNFELFAESAAPRFIFSDGFYMLFEQKEVHMNTQWFFDRKFSDEQLIWATYHELAHFYDFAEDHRAILGKFESIGQQARETGGKLAEKFRATIPPERTAEFEKYFEQQPMDPERPERGTMNRFEAQAYGIHHEFWNIMDDIYVNSLVAKRKPVYSKGGAHTEDVKRLYREQLFKGNDLSNLPRHKQYMYALIRQVMVPDEDVLVNDEIRETLARTLKISGKEKTASEIVREYVQSPGSIGRKAGVRYLGIEVSLEPIFLELLSKDLEEWEPKLPEKKENEEKEKSQNGESGEQKKDDGGEKQESKTGGEDTKEEKGEDGGEQGKKQSGDDGKSQKEEGNGQSRKPMAENIDDAFNPAKKENGKPQEGKPGESGGDGPTMPRPIQSPEDLKNILDVLNKGKKEWQEARRKKEAEKAKKPKTEEELKNELDVLRKKQFAEQWAKEFEMTPEAFEQAEREYEETEREIRPYLAALDLLWQRIIYGKSRENVQEAASRFKTGIDIDIDEVVRQFPEIATRELDKVRVMTRTETVREFVERPELIRVRFVGDASGSMDDERRKILKQAFVLIFTSLRRFETFLNLSRGRTKSKLSVDTEAWVFGDEAHQVKPFRGKTSRYEREKAATVASFAGLGKNRGGTRDDRALLAIHESITPEEARNIKAKKIMELVFELTDGGTSSRGIANAKRALADLDEKGVITRAFQIGTTDADEQATFEDVWNTSADGMLLAKEKQRGHIVGAELKNLVPTLTAALAKYLGRVKL